MQSVFVDQESLEQCKRMLNEQGKIFRFETQVYRREQDVVWVSISARSVSDPNGEVLYYEGSLMDITERKQAETIQTGCQSRLCPEKLYSQR